MRLEALIQLRRLIRSIDSVMVKEIEYQQQAAKAAEGDEDYALIHNKPATVFHKGE